MDMSAVFLASDWKVYVKITRSPIEAGALLYALGSSCTQFTVPRCSKVIGSAKATVIPGINNPTAIEIARTDRFILLRSRVNVIDGFSINLVI
jgi:hypothetical protein